MMSSEAESPKSAAAVPVARGFDRRSSPTPRFSRYSFTGGRRGEVRRQAEREGAFVDRYGRGLLFAVCWVALMNVADSFFTLIHLQAGGIEVNPIAQGLLSTGRTSFVLCKSTLISLALIVLCMHKNFALARLGLWLAAGSYTILVAYHLALFVL